MMGIISPTGLNGFRTATRPGNTLINPSWQPQATDSVHFEGQAQQGKSPFRHPAKTKTSRFQRWFAEQCRERLLKQKQGAAYKTPAQRCPKAHWEYQQRPSSGKPLEGSTEHGQLLSSDHSEGDLEIWR